MTTVRVCMSFLQSIVRVSSRNSTLSPNSLDSEIPAPQILYVLFSVQTFLTMTARSFRLLSLVRESNIHLTLKDLQWLCGENSCSKLCGIQRHHRFQTEPVTQNDAWQSEDGKLIRSSKCCMVSCFDEFGVYMSNRLRTWFNLTSDTFSHFNSTLDEPICILRLQCGRSQQQQQQTSAAFSFTALLEC